MKNKNCSFSSSLIIIFGGGVHQVPYVKFCQKNKIQTLVIDRNPRCPAKEYANLFLNIDTPNSKSTMVYNSIKNIVPKSNKLGVLVAGVELAILGAYIAKKFKIKGINETTANFATNKIIRAKKFKFYKIPYANFQIVNNLNNLKKKFPFVIKTEFGSGSRGVRVISSSLDLQYAKKHLKNLNNSKYLVEDFLNGHEISIEAFIYVGKFHYYCFAIRDIKITHRGKLIEYGSISDPNYDTKKLKLVKSAFEKACLKLGFTEGPVKGDILLNETGPFVLEVAARSAPLAPLISNKVYGFDMVSNHIKWCLGMRPSFKSIIKNFSKTKPVCHRYLSHKKGEIISIKGIDRVKKSKNVIKLVILRNLKFPMKIDEQTNTNRILYLVTTGVDAARARLNADKCLSNIHITYK